VPIPVYPIEHPKGRALFDTGLHPDCHRDPAGRLVARIAGLFKIGFRPVKMSTRGSKRLTMIWSWQNRSRQTNLDHHVGRRGLL